MWGLYIYKLSLIQYALENQDFDENFTTKQFWSKLNGLFDGITLLIYEPKKDNELDLVGILIILGVYCAFKAVQMDNRGLDPPKDALENFRKSMKHV